MESSLQKYSFDSFSLSKEEFTKQFNIAFGRLTRNSRYINSGEFVLINRLEKLCFKKDTSLFGFFLQIEKNIYVGGYLNSISSDARLLYRAIDLIAKDKSISDYAICLSNNWNISNFRREKALAISGGRKTFSLMKLYGILSVLDISFSSFFQYCEELNES